MSKPMANIVIDGEIMDIWPTLYMDGAIGIYIATTGTDGEDLWGVASINLGDYQGLVDPMCEIALTHDLCADDRRLIAEALGVEPVRYVSYGFVKNMPVLRFEDLSPWEDLREKPEP